MSNGGAADMLYAIYGAMVSASWSCLGSGTGAAGGYSSSGSLITSAATFNSVGAWVRMREPSGAGGREYLMMRGLTATGSLIKYSRSTGFVSGSPGAATAPHTGASGDGQVILGVGTDVNATIAGSGSILTDNGTGYAHCVASDTANNGVYGFWAMKTAPTTGILGSFFCSEAVQAGTTNAADTDPSWRVAVGTTARAADWWSYSTPFVSWWEKYGLAGATYRTTCNIAPPASVSSAGATVTQTSAFPFGALPMGQDPYDPGKAAFINVMLTKYNGTGVTSTWPKGYTTGIQMGSTSQTLLDVFNYSTSEPRILINTTVSLVMPWVPNVTPVV
jgi:hypothetical protein